MTKDEFSASYMKKKSRKEDNERWIFCFLYEKRRQDPAKNGLIDYYHDEERNPNVDGYPNAHMTLWQSSGE